MRAILQVVNDVIHGDFGAIEGHWNDAMSQISNSWTGDFANALQSNPIAQAYGVNTDNSGNAPTGYAYNSGSDNGQMIVQVFVDGQEVASQVQKRMRNQGANMYYGGTLTYGK